MGKISKELPVADRFRATHARLPFSIFEVRSGKYTVTSVFENDTIIGRVLLRSMGTRSRTSLEPTMGSRITPMTTLPIPQSFHRPHGVQPHSAKLWAGRILWKLASARRWLRLSTRILWLEGLSIVPRIRVGLDAIDESSEEGDLGPLFEESTTHGDLVPCKRTDARTRDVERFLTTHEWANSADLHCFLLGWTMGETFSCGSPHKTKKGTVESDEVDVQNGFRAPVPSLLGK